MQKIMAVMLRFYRDIIKPAAFFPKVHVHATLRMGKISHTGPAIRTGPRA